MKFLKYISIFICLMIIGLILYFYITIYSKLTPAKIDENIKKSKIFLVMDKQKEIINGTEINDSIPRKKSSSVIFYADKKPTTKKEFEAANFNNCRAINWKGKNRITLGFNSGFSGGGYEINYLLGRFEIKPYSFTDVVPDNSKEPEYKILKQEITLDKFYYKVGDSIYGKIDFEIEEKFNRKKYKVYGKGYFRTKLEKL